jgi:hypothetical protein
MELLSKLLLHLVWDTFVLFIILRVTVRDHSVQWRNVGLVSLGMAVWKSLLFLLMGVPAVVPILLSLGLYLHWAYSLTTRQILYILGAFLFAGIAFGAIGKMAYGVLELFFI